MKNSVLLVLADQYASIGLLDKALVTAGNMKVPSLKAKALIAIARGYANEQHTERVKEMLMQATEAAGTTTTDDRAELMTLVAEMYAVAGQSSMAIETARSIKDPGMVAVALAKVVGQLLEKGDSAAALEVVKTIQDTYIQVAAAARIAGEYAKMQQNEKSTHLLEWTTTAAKDIGDPLVRDGAYELIAGSYAAAGDYEQAFEAAGDIEDAYTQASALTVIASEFARTDRVLGNQALGKMAAILVKRYPLELIGR